MRDWPVLSVMVTRSLFLRRTRAVRVGPREDPRFEGQGDGWGCF